MTTCISELPVLSVEISSTEDSANILKYYTANLLLAIRCTKKRAPDRDSEIVTSSQFTPSNVHLKKKHTQEKMGELLIH